ncbi:MAG: M3 family oligoendopeptidase [Anaerolineales bacterium]
MIETLPQSAMEALEWPWQRFAPAAEALLSTPLTADNLESWMQHWSHFSRLLEEIYARLYIATTADTTDVGAEARFNHYLDEIYPAFQTAEQQLIEKLLASGLTPRNFSVPLRNLRTQSELFRESNLPLLTHQKKLDNAYDQLVGAQTIAWDGQELTLPQLTPIFQDPDRSRRERAYRQSAGRWLQDRTALNDLWVKLLDLRQEIAHNAGFESFRDYRWRELLRFDYTPADCQRFHEAIEAVVVPAAGNRYEKRRQKLGLDSLRPWDTTVDPLSRPPLQPYQQIDELINRTQAMFSNVDPQLGQYFQQMETGNLLDLENRKGKAPGGFCISFPLAGSPFIFMNAVGLHEDVQTMLHEGGHAFHTFEIAGLPYYPQHKIPMEFAEVASMAMELLAAPYLTQDQGGFYNPAQAARARIEHLETSLLFWPYMAVVDAFQQWVYTHPEDARDPDECDAHWSTLWDRFMPGIDFTGLEEHKATGWQRKVHIFQEPFYYVEYGLAQLGAVQVWHNARQDQAGAVAAYRRALALGGTASLPELFRTAGAQFAFDVDTLSRAIQLMVATIEELEQV